MQLLFFNWICYLLRSWHIQDKIFSKHFYPQSSNSFDCKSYGGSHQIPIFASLMNFENLPDSSENRHKLGKSKLTIKPWLVKIDTRRQSFESAMNRRTAIFHLNYPPKNKNFISLFGAILHFQHNSEFILLLNMCSLPSYFAIIYIID